MMLPAADLKNFQYLFMSGNWIALHRAFTSIRTDIREDTYMQRLITLDSVPLHVYLAYLVPPTDLWDDRRVFASFDDDFMKVHCIDFLSSDSDLVRYFGTQYVQELMDRGDTMNEVFETVLKYNADLLDGRSIAQKAVNVSRERNNNMLNRVLQIRMAKEIASNGGSLESFAPIQIWQTLKLQVKEEDRSFCFQEFFRFLKDSHPSLLERPDIVHSLGLVNSAIEYRKEYALRYIFTQCHGILLLNGATSIFCYIALSKCSVSLALALGVGASVEEQVHYPINIDVLLDVDHDGLSPLHHLWIMPTEHLRQRDKREANRYSKDLSIETVLVEKTLMCIRTCKQKFPDILHHFGKAWTCVSSLKTLSDRKIPLIVGNTSSMQYELYSIGMMRRIVHAIASEQGRKTLHVSCEYGISWAEGLRILYREEESIIDMSDPLTNLKPFALAACSKESNIDTIYELLVRNPGAIE